MRDSFVTQVHEVLRENPALVFLTGDLGFGIFDEIRSDVGSQFINVGVAEQNMIGIATGLSLSDKSVFCYSIANFSFMRGLEQFRNGPIYHQSNVTLVCSGGGFTYGQLGFTHFAIEDYGILSTFPSLEILHPATSEQVRACTKYCVASPGPKYLRLEKAELAFPARDLIDGELGLVLHRRGQSASAILAIGSLLEEAMSAGDLTDASVYTLVRHGAVESESVLKELGQFDRLLTIEEHVTRNCVGQKLKAAGLDVISLTISDAGPAVVGDQGYLRMLYGLTAHGIVAALETDSLD